FESRFHAVLPNVPGEAFPIHGDGFQKPWRLAGRTATQAELVLGYDRFEPYETDRAFFGAVVGRFANRIGGGRFTIAGNRYQTEQNFLGKHTLHGGSEGFFHRP
ncbi:hypothetical protein EN795_36560, partial [bacterium M00.F.Ca.ET.152.01.1.1]